MDKHLQECLSDSFEKEYVLPFFWQHGESHALLQQEMDAIYDSGCRQFCVESRTHEDFCGESWWEDFGFILAYAEKRGMKVWLLDDKRFPTGYANGSVTDHPELGMVHLRQFFRDYAVTRGPLTLLVPPLGEKAVLERVVAYRLNEAGDGIVGEGVDLTAQVREGLVYAVLPAGLWRVYFIHCGNFAPAHKQCWIDMLNPESAKLMLKAVYESTYAHFSRYFGNTFVGFFSDEPSFANESGHYYSIPGKEDMPLPYRSDLCSLLAEKLGKTEAEVFALLPALWHTLETPDGAAMRCFYMETITKLYRENFSAMLGDWCRARGVMYIGHVIEDNGTHMRLGYGAGHFFRALDGQDMAGLDVVLHQIVPGFTGARHAASIAGTYAYPEMFHYLLAKLGSSHSHVDPLKKGRAMCEIYGAYGWAEGLPLMKRLTDHMLVNGINRYVPHAFTPKHNDPDCPPHFYNGGQNTQFALFGKLMDYMQRVSHLISGCTHRADVAVLYAPEGEWAGCGRQLPEKVTRTLTQAQIDFDILPADRLCETAVRNAKLLLNGESYGAVIVPYCHTLPAWILEQLAAIAGQMPVIFVDALPEAAAGAGSAAAYTADCRAIPLEQLAGSLRGADLAQLTLSAALPLVRFYHVSRGGCETYLFVNDDIWNTADFTVQLQGEDFALYDAMHNTLSRPQCTAAGVRLCIAPGDMVIVTSGVTQPLCAAVYEDGLTAVPVQTTYTVSKRAAGSREYLPAAPALADITAEDPTFCGTIRYEFTLPETKGEKVLLDLGVVGETAELWVNGVYAGFALCDPYVFDVTGLLTQPENTLRVEVLNNQAYRLRDNFSTFLPLPASGMLGPVVLKIKA